MSESSRNNRPDDSIEVTRRKKMEEFRRSADHHAIRGDYDDGGRTAAPEEKLTEPAARREPVESASQPRRRSENTERRGTSSHRYREDLDSEPFESRRRRYDDEDAVNEETYDDEPSPRRRRRNREINSYSDNDTKKRIERDSKKALKQQKKEEKRIEKSKAKRNRRIFKLVWITMIIVIGVVLSQYLLVGINDLMAISREDNPAKVMIHVPADPTMDDIAKLLYDANAIKQPGFFKLYANFTSSEEGFRQGDFEIETDKDYEALINFLQSNVNRTDIVKLQVTEGMNLLEIVSTLHEKGVINDEQEFLSLCNSDYFDTDFTFLKDIKNKDDRYYKLEGYLFPDTYDFYVGENPKSVISKFLNNYDSKIVQHKEKYFGNSKKTTLVEEAAQTGYSFDEILTIASIIQAEAASRDDMYEISAILHNRLKYGTETGTSKLNCDSTFYYPYRKADNVPDSIRDSFTSRYNTDEIDGLPAGPICNPGAEAIKAAIKPNESDNLYFCHDKEENGSTPYYAKTNEQHEANLRAIENGTTNTYNEYNYGYDNYYYDYSYGSGQNTGQDTYRNNQQAQGYGQSQGNDQSINQGVYGNTYQ